MGDWWRSGCVWSHIDSTEESVECSEVFRQKIEYMDLLNICRSEFGLRRGLYADAGAVGVDR